MDAVSPPRKTSLVGPAIATLVMAAILVGLGVWQLQRKAWKEDLIRTIEARAYAAPMPVPPEAAWPGWTALDGDYRRAVAVGRYDYANEVAVHDLAPGEGPGRPLQGVDLLTPLIQADGSRIIVNRGFVPRGWPGAVARPEGEVTVTGIVRAPQAHAMFVPPDDPARGEWFTRDPAAIAAARGLARTAPFLLDAAAVPGAAPDTFPRGGLTHLDIPDNHLQYAFTWFGLAATCVAVFAAFAWSRRGKATAG